MSFISSLTNRLISAPVGNNLTNDIDDIKRVKSALFDLDYLAAKDNDGHGYITRPMDNAIKDFQQREDLKQDGKMLPDGETQQRMEEKLSQKFLSRPLASRFLDENEDKDGDDGDDDKDKKTPPPPSRKPPPPKGDKDPEDDGDVCAEEKAGLERVKFIVKDIEGRIETVEDKLGAAKQERTEILEKIEKEKKEARNAKNIGAAIGLFVGAAIGARGGPGGAAAIGGKGIGIGGSIGKSIEEGTDIVTSQETTYSLERRLANIEKTIEVLVKRLDDLQKELKDAEKLLVAADDALASCKLKNG